MQLQVHKEIASTNTTRNTQEIARNSKYKWDNHSDKGNTSVYSRYVIKHPRYAIWINKS